MRPHAVIAARVDATKRLGTPPGRHIHGRIHGRRPRSASTITSMSVGPLHGCNDDGPGGRVATGVPSRSGSVNETTAPTRDGTYNADGRRHGHDKTAPVPV